ncbi:MAG TPA: histidine phosphatase family protein [Acidimicrobiales bacterium]|jgi:probable phosphoglycerate mutase|nr:histidine phosphatase family protein [Acidimicrobiales bacterium]
MTSSKIDSPAPRNVARLVLVRHASTAWSRSGKHTGRTDIPLDQDGQRAARSLAPTIASLGAVKAYSSPLRRALDTCSLSGLGDGVVVDPDLVEWDYGEYEGMTSAQISARRPGWDLFVDGCPGGERASDVSERVARFFSMLSEAEDPSVVVFAHGHLLRVLGARWLGLPPEAGRSFLLGAPSVSTLVWEHGNPAVERWNG